MVRVVVRVAALGLISLGAMAAEPVLFFAIGAHVDPLVEEGRIRWATFSEMADAFTAWEETHPGVDPRGVIREESPETECRGYITFVVNVHDFVNVDESADTLLRLIGIFERYGVRGDFYLTGPQMYAYLEHRPDVIARLKDSGMTISYHVRPPHPAVPGFDRVLSGLSPDEVREVFRDYETYRLDLRTGRLLRDQPGGFTLLTQIFGHPRWWLRFPAPNGAMRSFRFTRSSGRG